MKTLVMPFIITCFAIPLRSQSQEAEKEKIKNVIVSELDYWYNKERDKWASCVVQTNEFQLTSASARNYHVVRTFDSLDSSTHGHFSSPVDPNVPRIRKTDFSVSLKGDIALVDFTLRGDDFPQPFIGDQFIIMERQGKSWKILRQHTVVKSSYTLNDSNIEAELNDQGYKFLQLEKFDEAIKVFTLNTELFPNAWNTWDSLADAYMRKGEKQIAFGFFKKSLQLNPQNGYAKEMLKLLAKD